MSKSFITINFKEGRNLVAKDSNGASDPYVKAFVPTTFPVTKSLSTVKSKVIKANLNPKWNFIITAFQGVTPDALASLPAVKVELWDKDTLSDDSMGQIEVPTAKLASNPVFEEWIDVKPRSAKDKVSGQVLVALKFVEVKYDPEAEKRIKENSKLSLAELSKLEKEFKKTGNSVQSKTDLLNLLIKLNLLQPLVAKSLQRSGKENLTSLEKTILGELYKDQGFMDLIAETLFDTMDSDRSGSIDWQELVIGLSVLSRGSRGDTARLKFKVIDVDNSGTLTKDEYKKMAEKDLRSTFAAMRIGFKVGFRVGIEQAASSKKEAAELKKMMNELPFEKIFSSIEALFTSPELLTTLVDMVFTYADLDKNGTISEEEFVKWSEDLEQQALFSLQVQQTLAPFLEQLAMDVQQEFVSALQEYM